MLQSLLKIIKFADILAPGTHLNVNGGWSIRSWLGVFLALVYGGLTMYCVVQQISEFRDTTQPFVAIETKLNSEYPSIDLIKNKHVPIIFAFAGETVPLSSEEYPAYFTLMYKRHIFIIPEDGSEVTITESTVPTVPCKVLLDKGIIKLEDFQSLKGYKSLLAERGICADVSEMKNLTVTGSFFDAYEEFFSVLIYPCSLDDSSLCKPKEDVTNVTIQFLKPAVGMDLSNKENPIRYDFSGEDYYYLNTDVYQLLSQQLVDNRITDRNGFLIPDEEVVQYTTYGQKTTVSVWRDGGISTTKDIIDAGGTNPYIWYELASGMKYNAITRTYTGFLDYLGTIGGINSILFGAFTLLYQLYHKKAEKEAMVHAIYGLKVGRKPRRCCARKSYDPHAANRVGPSPASFLTKSGMDKPIDPEIEGYSEKGTIYVSSKVIDEAFDTIRSNLDMVTICREINTIRCLASLLVKDYQKDLVPLMSLSKYMQEKRDREAKQKIVKNSCTKFLNKVASDLPLDDRQLDVKECMSKLVKQMEKNESVEIPGLKSSPNNLRDLQDHKLDHEDTEEKDLVDKVLDREGLITKAFEVELNNHAYVSLANVSALMGIPEIVPESRMTRMIMKLISDMTLNIKLPDFGNFNFMPEPAPALAPDTHPQPHPQNDELEPVKIPSVQQFKSTSIASKSKGVPHKKPKVAVNRKILN